MVAYLMEQVLMIYPLDIDGKIHIVLFMQTPIETWLLLLTLFLPRLGLLIAWFSGDIPPNTVPFFGDMILAIILPRLLMLIYIATNLGFEGWFFAHTIAWAIAIFLAILRKNTKD